MLSARSLFISFPILVFEKQSATRQALKFITINCEEGKCIEMVSNFFQQDVKMQKSLMVRTISSFIVKLWLCAVFIVFPYSRKRNKTRASFKAR